MAPLLLLKDLSITKEGGSMSQAVIFFSLQQGLTQFGLNPIEWSIIKNTSNSYYLVNNDDPQFQLLGSIQIKQQKAKWKNIQLLSI